MHALRLFVAGKSVSSERAREDFARIIQNGVPADWLTEIVDVLASPEEAERSRILATPTLSYEQAGRQRRIIGDLSDTPKVLQFLGIEQESGSNERR